MVLWFQYQKSSGKWKGDAFGLFVPKLLRVASVLKCARNRRWRTCLFYRIHFCATSTFSSFLGQSQIHFCVHLSVSMSSEESVLPLFSGPIDPLTEQICITSCVPSPQTSVLRTHKEPKIDFLSQSSALVLTFVGTFTLKFLAFTDILIYCDQTTLGHLLRGIWGETLHWQRGRDNNSALIWRIVNPIKFPVGLLPIYIGLHSCSNVMVII